MTLSWYPANKRTAWSDKSISGVRSEVLRMVIVVDRKQELIFIPLQSICYSIPVPQQPLIYFWSIDICL